MKASNTLQEIVEEIVGRERDPVTCEICDTEAGRAELYVVLDDLADGVNPPGFWVCDGCDPEFKSIEEELEDCDVDADEIVDALEREVGSDE